MQITLFSLLWSAVWCVILSALIWLLRKSGRCPAKVSVPLYTLYFQDETSDQLSEEGLELYTSAGFTIIEE